MTALIRARDLRVSFQSDGQTVNAVNGVSFDLSEGETLCILGESGSGKSVTLRSILQLHPARKTRTEGSLEVVGQDVIHATDRQMAELRGRKVSMIFQEPMTALDPVFTIGSQISETIRRHEGCSRTEARKRALELLEQVHIPSAARRLDAYPHELSGGLRQRAMIAIALSCRPRVLIADEPTTALDATVQIQILMLMRELQREMGMGMIFVTHDLGVAAEISDRIAVMYAGRFIEEGRTGDVIDAPLHPYTSGLLGATVHPDARGSRLTTIPGAPPPLTALPPGCAFAPRCGLVQDACRAAMPQTQTVAQGRSARCLRIAPAPVPAKEDQCQTIS